MPCEEEEEGVVYCVGLVKGQRYLHTPSHGAALLGLQFNEFLHSHLELDGKLSALEEETTPLGQLLLPELSWKTWA